MGRAARIVIPGIPHHVTQRGNRRGQVFFTDAQRHAYLADVETYAHQFEVAVLAYCLMTNHTHLILVPQSKDSLHLMLKAIHTRHALRVNKYNSWRGHLWQDRYFSAPVDAEFVPYVIAYVELNPVRGGIVTTPMDYQWSSIHARINMHQDPIIDLTHPSVSRIPCGDRWLGSLKNYYGCTEFDQLRSATYRNHPFGGDVFISELEYSTSKVLRAKPPGPAPKVRDR